MKPCGTCGRSLQRESFSKKQWQSKKCRRCKNCVANDRQTVSEAELDLASLSLAETAANDALQEPRSNGPRMPRCNEDRRAKAWTDEDLFKAPPPRDDCPICLIRMPLSIAEMSYHSCCGKFICIGCVYAFGQQSTDKCSSCPFCRTPEPLTDQENKERLMKRVKNNDPDAMHILAYYYSCGSSGLPQDHGKAMELWHLVGELGMAAVYCNVGEAYRKGEGVETNMEKAKYYYTLAAIGGCAGGRLNLGSMELMKGDADRAVKHYLISAGCGHNESVAEIRKLYAQGRTSKEDFAKALRAYGEDRAETKSDQREADAADPDFMQS